MTLTQGGVSKGTFTANATGDVTIALDGGSATPQVQSDYTQADTAAVDFIKNKPDLTDLATALQPGDNVSELTNDASYITLAEVPLYTAEAGKGIAINASNEISIGDDWSSIPILV